LVEEEEDEGRIFVVVLVVCWELAGWIDE